MKSLKTQLQWIVGSTPKSQKTDASLEGLLESSDNWNFRKLESALKMYDINNMWQ